MGRMMDDTVLDTTIHEPSMTAGEAEMGTNPIAKEDVRIVPANEASWDDLRDIFGITDYPARC